jgi:molybdopterin-guanine dinucleotide biosynthesis protein A
MSLRSPYGAPTPSGLEEPDIAGIVLAGGASRRMGTDKAALRMPDGEVLLDRAVRHLTEAGADEVVVATGTAGRLGELPWTEVGDGAHAGRGPLAGLLAALSLLAGADRPPLALVLAVDLPFASPTVLRWLARELAVTGVPGLLPLAAVAARPQPLHAAYQPAAVAPHLAASLAAGELRVLRALAAAGAVQVAVPGADRDWHRNVNTPLDLRRARE